MVNINTMRILIIAEANSIHTQRWVKSLSKKGFEILLFSLNHLKSSADFSNIKVHTNYRSKNKLLNIALSVKDLKVCIANYKPHILHAHYASSYGLLGALVNYHPFLLSIWGSDIYEFPKRSILHKLIIKYVLHKADRLLSTSNIMAVEISKYTSKKIDITPFGVDTNVFKKIPNITNKIIIGNVKTLSYNYGIDILISAFAKLYHSDKSYDLSLYIIGEGPNKLDFINLTKELKIESSVNFVGKIPNNKLPYYYSMFNVAVFPSLEESFGVAAVEAMACECPVVVSDADGFKEVVQDKISGIIVPRGDVHATYLAIKSLIDNTQYAYELGVNARNRVTKLYDWNDNVDLMSMIYYNTQK